VSQEDLERAKKKVDEQTRAANQRASLADRLRRWYVEQETQNGFREMIDTIVRGAR